MQPGKAADDADLGDAAPVLGGKGKATSPLRRFVWPLVCLFQLGLIAGAFQLGLRLSGPETVAPVEEAPQEHLPIAAPRRGEIASPLQSATGPAARSELDEVDRLLRVGRYELGLTLCRSFSNRAVAGLGDAFQYRLSLCLEGMGHWDEALTSYRKLASHTASSRMSAIALLGQARIWLRMRRPTEGKALLCDLLRRSALPDLRNQPFLADARYLLALAIPLEILPIEQPGPFNDNPVSPLTADWSLDRALDWDTLPSRDRQGASSSTPSHDRQGVEEFPLPDGRGSAKGETSVPPEIVAVQPGTASLVRISVNQMPLASLLDRLAEQAHLRIDWTARARQQIEGRSVVVALEQTSLTDALRVLAEPLGLVWTIQSGKLAFSSEEEASPAALKLLRLDNARRALREAVLLYQRHPLTPAAYLELGDLEALAGRIDEALAWYGRLIREWPRTPLVIEAQFNLGLLHTRRSDRAAARQAFYRVVDRAPAHELAPLAYWRIGRIYLDEGDPQQALSPLRRALRSGPGSPTHAAAAITLAAAHLLTDNPRAANTVLLEHRELVSQEHYRNAAAFLDTLARFRAITDRRMRQRESSELLTALLTVRDDPIVGPSGLVLMGQAYQELGMHEEMVRVYEKALPKLRGPLASELLLALADAWYERGESALTADKREAALSLYRKVIAGGPSNGARRARLRLAQIALTEKKPQDCLKSCRELLQEKTGVDVPAVLRLMAGAYEQAGERDKAIRCLSGELPN
ncbi:MAG TPA: tetratricopeptide repeat protein [Gemmataceae bacterium]|nr:tetratricopeptide repeat protein [Gemmataceae bacterium]